MTTKILTTVLIGLLTFVPLASADHGLTGTIVAQMDDGTVAKAKIVYVGGVGETQTWRFTWTTNSGSFTCNGFGNIEVGFTSVACATSFTTAGTGDLHVYPYSQADVHEIAVNVGGVGGTGQQIICPDGGAGGTACNLALGLGPA